MNSWFALVLSYLERCFDTLSFKLSSISIEMMAMAGFSAILATILVVVLMEMGLVSKDASYIFFFLIMFLTLASLLGLSLWQAFMLERKAQLLFTFLSSPTALLPWLAYRFTLGGVGELLYNYCSGACMMVGGQEVIPAGAPEPDFSPFRPFNLFDSRNISRALIDMEDPVSQEADMTEEDKNNFREACAADKDAYFRDPNAPSPRKYL